MQPENSQRLAQEIINKDKWWDMLSRFIDVLRINIFLVDAKGLFILPPDRSRFAGRLLMDRSLGFDLLNHPQGFLGQFITHDNFLQAVNKYQLATFAIPILTPRKQTIAYLVVGPVVLNKRLDKSEYIRLAEEGKVNPDELVGEINEIRVVSHMMMKSILDLLNEIMRDHVDIILKEKELKKVKEGQEPQSKSVEAAAQEIYSSVRLDELLVTLLDVALKMTNAECGSIMISDKDKGFLTVKAFKGLDPEKMQNVRIKVGEGIAGIAAQEKSSFVIKGQEGDNRIQHLLKRPEIKEALVIPLQSKEGVFGVLNLSTKEQTGHFEENLDNLRYLTTLVSSAF